MNNNRRKDISALKARLDDLDIESLVSDLESIRDEEQDYLDNMPEGLQGGDKGTMAEEAIGALEEALEALGEIQSYIDAAGDALDNATA